MPVPSVFSPAIVLVLAVWIYAVNALAVPPHSLLAHAVAIALSIVASSFLEWLRSRNNPYYAAGFLILLTLAPLLYRYQHG